MCLQNDSDASIEFQLFEEPPSSSPSSSASSSFQQAFAFSETSGVLAPHQSHLITITFQPTLPINFYRRVFVLLRHAAPLVSQSSVFLVSFVLHDMYMLCLRVFV